MKYHSKIIFFPLLASIASTASAVVVGDKDWMQLTASGGYSWNEYDAIFDTTTGQCDVLGCLLGGTLDLTEYTWASNSEVDALFQNYTGSGLASLNSDSRAYFGPNGLDVFFQDFTATSMPNSSYEFMAGWTRNSSDISGNGDTFGAVNELEGNNDYFNLEIHNLATTKFDSWGGWLYKPAISQVPVPASIWLLGSGLLGLIGISRRKKSA